MDESNRELPVQAKWWRLGLALAVVYYVFLFLVISLLNIDQTFALVVVVGASIVGGVVLTVFVLYVY